MRLVDSDNVVAVVRCWEYMVGKPKETVEVISTPTPERSVDYSALTLEERVQLRSLMQKALEKPAPREVEGTVVEVVGDGPPSTE
jgi:hypothetical protein